MEFLSEYGIFLAKALTIVAALLVIISGIAAASSKGRKSGEGYIEVKKFNDKLKNAKEELESYVLSKDALKSRIKDEKKAAKQKSKENKVKVQNAEPDAQKSVYVIDFDGDIRASDTSGLREAITAVLTVAKPGKDEVVVRLESGGGMVHSYGLASAQLNRIKNKGVELTVCVDKVAASGGYMMACVADKVIASPFAILGSIGVVAQIPNFNKLLKKNDIDFEVLTAGEHKRTLTLFGENTEQGREKFLHDLHDTHELFKNFVREHRPVVDVAKVANGDVWFGKRALEVHLVDDLMTSDEYLITCSEDRQVFEVSYKEHKSLPEKLGMAASVCIQGGVEKVLTRLTQSRFMQ